MAARSVSTLPTSGMMTRATKWRVTPSAAAAGSTVARSCSAQTPEVDEWRAGPRAGPPARLVAASEEPREACLGTGKACLGGVSREERLGRRLERRRVSRKRPRADPRGEPEGDGTRARHRVGLVPVRGGVGDVRHSPPLTEALLPGTACVASAGRAEERAPPPLETVGCASPATADGRATSASSSSASSRSGERWCGCGVGGGRWCSGSAVSKAGVGRGRNSRAPRLRLLGEVHALPLPPQQLRVRDCRPDEHQRVARQQHLRSPRGLVMSAGRAESARCGRPRTAATRRERGSMCLS